MLVLSIKALNAHHFEVSELVTLSQYLCGNHFPALGSSRDLQWKIPQKSAINPGHLQKHGFESCYCLSMGFQSRENEHRD